MAAVVFYRAPTDGLRLRKLKKQNKTKKHYNDQKRLFSKKISLFKAGPMQHKHPFLKKFDKMG